MIGFDELGRLTSWLDRFQRPVLVTHRRPDGDGLGALAGMGHILRARGARPVAMLFEPLSARYDFLEAPGGWTLFSEKAGGLSGADSLVILDTCSLSQLEPLAPSLPTAPPTLVIDHHLTRDAIGVRPQDMQLIDPTAGATCLIVAEWLAALEEGGLGGPVDSQAATALFTGLATDCGWFQFSNTDARMLRAAADLVRRGAAPAAIHAALYQREPAARLRLLARALGSLELHAGGALAVMSLREADFAAAGADRSMTEELVNEPGRIAGVQAMILFVEEAPDLVRVNLRSKGRLDVSRLAAGFGGGGHAQAAGARIRGPWESTTRRVIAAACAALGASPQPGGTPGRRWGESGV